MALPSTFQERLRHMEETRDQRLALLQVEKEIQMKKSEVLTNRIANIRRMEQRCLLLEKRSAELRFQIVGRRCEIDALDARYNQAARQFRVLKGEIDGLEMQEKTRDLFYEAKLVEMMEFEERVGRFVEDSRKQVEELRNSILQLKSTMKDLQNNDEFANNAEITNAEARKAELLATKEKLDRSLASNSQLRALLRNQLQKMLISQESREPEPQGGL